MSSQIPPLFCQTPPPIDFGNDEDDDVDLPDPDDDEFDDFSSIPPTSVGSELPTPVPSPFRNYGAPAGNIESPISQDETIQIHNEASLTIPLTVIGNDSPQDQSRVESPPSLVLSQHNYSENDVPSEDEFQDFAFHPHTVEKDTDIPPGTEDNISIPSLHLDTVSKSETPVQLSENETSDPDISAQEVDMENVEPGPIAEVAVAPMVAEDPYYRCDDNTENDFTDFTTASNERSAVLEIPTANDVSFDDDFAQLESTPSADSNFVSQSKTDFATFDADFSKFDSFQGSFPVTFDESGSVPKDISSTRTNAEDKPTRETPRENELSYDEFADFQEYAKFPTENTSKQVETIPIVDQEQSSSVVEYDNEDDDDGDDDDFGDFSDFKQSEVAPVATSIPTSRSSHFTQESILNVITGMFPACAEEPQSDTGQSDILQDKVYHELKDMDFSRALSFQYNNSESSASLVRALGIDSRNILFGPKWNSSMPRFAANLSFSPLEPLKPNSVSFTADTTSNSIMTGSCRSGKTDDTSKHLAFGLDPLQPDNEKAVLQLTSSSAPGMVPAVQFDWNSSGLVNPLEASHAHTLLLDLEQLEVMANLKDKINIDSSSSSCNAYTVQTLPSTTSLITTMTPTITATTIMANNCNNRNQSNNGGGMSLLDDMNLVCINNPPLPLEPTSASFPCAVAVNTCGASSRFSSTMTVTTVTTTATLPSPSSSITINPTTITTITTSTTTKNTLSSAHGDDHAVLTPERTTTNNLQSFDYYLDLSVQEILQEGGTHQPYKDGPKGEVLDKKIPENSGSFTSDAVRLPPPHVICIEKAIADEAHSLHYSNGSSDDINNDDKFELCNSSNETPSILPSASPTSIPREALSPVDSVLAEHSSSSSTVLAPNNLVRTIKLPETHIFTPSKCVNPISRDSTDRTEAYVGDPRAGDDLDKTIVFREYHDVEYSLEKSTSKKQGSLPNPTKNEEGIDDFCDFQTVGSSNISLGANKKERVNEPWCSESHLDSRRELNTRDKKKSINNYSKPVFGKSPTEELDQMDEEFCEFQTATPATANTKTIINKPLTNVAGEQIRSNTSSPMLLSPSILLPQQANPTPTTEATKATQINWPDPGIDPEEMARFEAAFPQSKPITSITSNYSTPKHNNSTSAESDDEWTDFVYSKPAAEPTVPSETQATTCPDSNQPEEWTDFIYSTPLPQNLSSSHNSFNYKLEGPRFNSWNQPQLAPPQFSSWNSSNFYYNLPGSTNNNYTKPPTRTHKVPTFPLGHGSLPMNNYHHTASQSATIPSNQSQRMGQSNLPGISQLPELSFITPNSSAGGNTAPGVKPLAHSFLNSVISSNSFAKK
ncbi:serine-rich adhesin for platelets isoform X1 [Toxorhynchites rutilus septentrionalis]|uniref:serine-rich adhesin for platelets isoform X1 n=1 Tax=Toxorhynchites rutilus septentrionalis TaxID=329112 RepID=UPI00247AC6B0|nr:serine-rich adhesin for platelets isoform X1 [Toxorhynchites rutilus septentrionalis]